MPTSRRKLMTCFFASLDVNCSNPEQFFRQVRRHLHPNSSSPPTHKLIHNESSYEGNEILVGWATYFDSLYTPPDTPLTVVQSEIVSSFNEALCDSPVLLTTEEVGAAISSLPRKKACGPDNISIEHIIFGGPYLIEIITLLFNSILLSGFISSCFRHGFIIPIPKNCNKDLSNPSNYHGISLLSSLSKLFEKLLLLYLDDLQASLNPLQGGFRRGVSCLHTSFIVQEAVASLRDKKKKAFVAFIDVKILCGTLV